MLFILNRTKGQITKWMELDTYVNRGLYQIIQALYPNQNLANICSRYSARRKAMRRLKTGGEGKRFSSSQKQNAPTIFFYVNAADELSNYENATLFGNKFIYEKEHTIFFFFLILTSRDTQYSVST